MPAAEATTREIDIAVGDLIGKTFDRADQILQVRRADLDAGAKLLPKRETLTADDFPAIRSARVTGEPRLTVVPLTTFSGSPAMLCSTALQVERRA